jgi:signal transduction histidine kinase
MTSAAEQRTDRPLGPDWVFDVVPMLVVALTALPSLIREGQPRPLIVTIPLGIGMVLPLALRRRAPMRVFAVLAAVALLEWALDVRLVAVSALLVALYTVAALCSTRATVVAAAAIEVGVVLAAVRWTTSDNWIAGFILLSGTAGAAIALGFYSKTRRAYLAQLQERANRMELERDQQGRLAAAAERARIAREMHDIVAHHLTVMITLSEGAAAALRQDPDRAQEALHGVAATGRQALDETRRLLGVLHSPDDTRSPQPDLQQLDELLAQVRAAGMPTTLRIEGARPPMSPGAELTIYRVVQEALTNSLKHAGPGATAGVALRYWPERIQVEITDDGAPHQAVAASGGHGLDGMRERISGWGGDFAAGPQREGGWLVSASLLLDASLSA